MSITITFGWWLLPLAISAWFIVLAAKEFFSAEQGISGAFGVLVGVFWLLPAITVWMIYFAVMYFTVR